MCTVDHIELSHGRLENVSRIAPYFRAAETVKQILRRRIPEGTDHKSFINGFTAIMQMLGPAETAGEPRL